MWHTTFIVLHATAATVALLAGVVSLRAGRLFRVYRVSLVVMAGALLPAVVVGWPDLELATRVAYSGLVGLAGVMLVRAEHARRRVPTRADGPTAAFVDAVGFTLVALADGFAIVAAIRAGVPGLGVAALGVGIVAAGHVALRMTKARLVRAPAAAPATMEEAVG